MRPRVWSTRVVFIQRHRRWWWNAWRESTATELYGFADSQEDASLAMYRAIEQAGEVTRTARDVRRDS
ncbi:hypothetical protein GCM10009609_51150 [Pseudonocardia aurantiaca]|uniref:DUF1508 domain-containing protein n=1 Tax=Pseudonocardia aurantiaca TaxID=75290 RepID=A0ABW4FRI1_9PSEU